MSLALGATYPDLVGAFGCGDHHVMQDDRFVLRVGVPRAIAGVDRMLRELSIAPESIDHFLPAVSSMQLALGLQRLIGQRCGVRPESWRMNLTRVGYLGGVGFMVVLDEMARGGRLRAGDLVCSFAEESSKWMSAGMVLRWNP